jgi:hypothetical protein
VSHPAGFSQSLHANGSLATLAPETSFLFATAIGVLFTSFIHNWPTFEFSQFINLSQKIIDQRDKY